MGTVTIFVGGVDDGEFVGFRVSFKGDQIGSYREEEGLTHTLYRCREGRRPAYRVHTADERDTQNPRYELSPSESDGMGLGYPYYDELYSAREVIRQWAMFAKQLDVFRTVDVDAE